MFEFFTLLSLLSVLLFLFKLRPAKGKSVAHEHVFILNEMWPAKENSAARDHVNGARRTKLF